MKKILLAILFTLVSFTTTFADIKVKYESGCFEIYSDGSAYFKVSYTGPSTTPADQELWVNNGTGFIIGPYMPDYTNDIGTSNWTNYYFLPAGTFSTPGSECIEIQQFKDIHPSETDEYKHEICRCDCDLDFSFIQYSSNNAASIEPLSLCSDCEYTFNYGAGEPFDWGATYSYLYRSSGTYRVCLWMKTPDGEICLKCKDFCINVSGEEEGERDAGYPAPERLWKNKQGESRQHKTESKLFRVFPNPSNGSINISGQLDRQTAITVRVANTLGQEVWKQEFSGDYGSFKHTILLDKLSNGIYTVSISADGKEETHRVSVAK